MKKIFQFTILFLCFAACKPKVVTEYKEVTALRASDLYVGDSVYQYIQVNKDSNKELADSYMKRSKEEEGINMNQAVYNCKRAITLDPTLDNYKSLAELLNKTNDFKELNRLYYVLVNTAYINTGVNKGKEEYLFGPPTQDLYAEYMICQLAETGSLYADLVYQARELKMNIKELKEKIFSDKRVHVDMTTTEAKNMMLMFLSEEELEAYNELPTTFKDFLASIPDVAPVFEINAENVRKFNYEDFNGSNEYEEYDGGPTLSYVYTNYLKEKKDDKDGWYRYNFNHLIDINDEVKAVVYAIDSSETACPIEMRHIYHRLVTYNKKSRIIDSKVIAMQSGERLVTASVNFNKITSTEYKRNWRKPYDKLDFDNDLLGVEKGAETSYEILPTGKIIEAGSTASN